MNLSAHIIDRLVIRIGDLRKTGYSRLHTLAHGILRDLLTKA